MKFIDKSIPNSKIYAERLHKWRDAYVYNKEEFPQYKGLKFSEFCDKPEFTSNKLWELLNNNEPYRKALRIEQNGLCCYCCKAFDKGSDKTAIEHFEDKGSKPCERTFDYNNLMLACEGNKNPKRYIFGRSDTWESIAIHFKTTVERLKAENSILSFVHGESIKIKLTHHCDVAKQSQTIAINPTQEKDCWKRFKYDANGTIEPVEGDEILKLNADILKQGRQVAWQAAVNNWATDVEIQDCNDTEDWTRLEQRREQLKEIAIELSFCPVYWYYYDRM